MAHAQLPIASLRLWQSLNNAVFNSTRIAAVPGKGSGLVVEDNSSPAAAAPLVSVPRGLVLHADAVEEYAKQDRNFRLLLDAAGRQTPRGDVLLFLLVQVVLGLRQPGEELAALPTPWTEYVKFLPADVPLPTLWTDSERLLLQGSSLETAVDAKLVALEREFDRLRERSSDIPFWQAAFWERESGPQLHHWFLVDAWYRSRCLDLPRSGPSMVPCIDMVNHSATPTAYYEEVSAAEAGVSGGDADSDDKVVLLLRPQQQPLAAPGEITISYSGSRDEDEAVPGKGEGKAAADSRASDCSSNLKPASEMLFSYGFIDPQSSRHSIVLPFHPFPDDPLAKVKLHVFGAPAPRLEIERLPSTARGEGGDDSDEDGSTDARGATAAPRPAPLVRWTCPFAYLMCVNEEDGIDFRLSQETDGSTQLRLFWQDEDATDSARDFAALTGTHELAPVFQLRVVTVLLEVIESQLERMQAAGGHAVEENDDEHTENAESGERADTDMTDGQPDEHPGGDSSTDGDIRGSVAMQAALLRDIESRVLTSALEELEAERSALLSDATVVAYLGSMDGAENDLANDSAPHKEEADESMHDDEGGDDDFS